MGCLTICLWIFWTLGDIEGDEGFRVEGIDEINVIDIIKEVGVVDAIDVDFVEVCG